MDCNSAEQMTRQKKLRLLSSGVPYEILLNRVWFKGFKKMLE
jgi:hypothetical protein